MLQFSVLIPQPIWRRMRRRLPELAAALEPCGQPYEVIVVDDASQPSTFHLLDKLAKDFPALRLLRLDEPSGVGVALSAGIQAAQGNMLVTLSPAIAIRPSRLRRCSTGCAAPTWWSAAAAGLACRKCGERLGRIPRWLLLGLEAPRSRLPVLGGPAKIFQNVTISAGMVRYLPALVARQGYRICETYVDHHGPVPPLQDVRPNPGDLLAAWWSCRRWRDQQAYEFVPATSVQPPLRLVGADGTTPAARSSPQLSIESVPYSQQAKRA